METGGREGDEKTEEDRGVFTHREFPLTVVFVPLNGGHDDIFVQVITV